MKKGYLIVLFILTFFMMSCSGRSIEARSFTYYDPVYGKFYLEVDTLFIDDLSDVITLTMKYTASQAHAFTLETLDDGKAGMMHAELRSNDVALYSSDDLPNDLAGGDIQFEINEKVFRHIEFSLTPFTDHIGDKVFLNGDYVIWLYVDGEFLIETDILIHVNI